MSRPRKKLADLRLAALLVGSDAEIEAAYRAGRGKYGVAPREERTSRDGVVFDSKNELARWEELRLMERVGEIGGLRRQVEYPLEVKGFLVGVYKADFVYTVKTRPERVFEHPCWKQVVEDFKGVRTPVYRLKKKLMLAIYGIEILETGAPQRRPRRAKR